MSEMPLVEVLSVSPAMAEEWLAKNPANRNIRKAAVDAYARDMLAGHWVLNGETVKISTTGHLLDGQHRLSAVVAAAVTVPLIVVSNIPASVMATVDAGVKRTYADALRLQGEQNRHTAAWPAPWIAEYAERAPMAARFAGVIVGGPSSPLDRLKDRRRPHPFRARASCD